MVTFHIKYQTLLEFLSTPNFESCFLDIIDETIYHTKNFDIISGLGVAKAYFGKSKKELESIEKLVVLSDKLGDIPFCFPVQKFQLDKIQLGIDPPQTIEGNFDFNFENLDFNSKKRKIDDVLESSSSLDCESNVCYVSDCSGCSNSDSDSIETPPNSTIESESNSDDFSVSDYTTESSDDSNSTISFKNFQPEWMSLDIPKIISPEFGKKLNAPTDLKNMTFCVTGLLDSLNRQQLFYYIHLKGGFTSENMKKCVNILVVGSTPGKTKLDLAKKYNTVMINEKEMLTLLTETTHSLYLKERYQKLQNVKEKVDISIQKEKVLSEINKLKDPININDCLSVGENIRIKNHPIDINWGVSENLETDWSFLDSEFFKIPYTQNK